MKQFFKISALWIVAICSSLQIQAQTTYYSRNATNGGNWNNVNSWTLNSDGSGGPVASIPQRIDHVVVLSGHTITATTVTSNAAAGESPNAVTDPNNNIAPFNNSGGTYFYHTGDITVNAGATIDFDQHTMLGGTTQVYGNFDANRDFVNIGRMDVYSGTFSVGDDFVLSGNSETNIDISSFSADDIYLDHSDARLCGLGDLTITDDIQEFNGANSATQVCAGFSILGCATCPFTGSGGFVLPVELLSFGVQEKEAYAHISWSTATETNNDYFTLERSYDGYFFEEIARVEGKGTVKTRQDYFFIDEDPMSGTSYYRLSQTDFDGTTEVFELAALNRINSSDELTFYPNPMTQNQIQFNASALAQEKELVISLVDVKGTTVFIESWETDRLGNANGVLMIEEELESGIYFLQVQWSDEIRTEKIVKL